ncbi:hypothetical protein YC2023_098736 [Brassica napus]
MYEDDEAKWVRVSGRENRRPSTDGSRFRGEDLDSRHRRPRHELTRNSIQDGRCRSSGFQGVRRERSRKDHFPYQERTTKRLIKTMSGNTKDKIIVCNNACKTTPAATAPTANA